MLNTCIFQGRIARDITFKEGTMNVARTSLAVARDFNKENGVNCDFINIVAFGNNANFLYKYFTKGKEILITTHVQVNSYKDKEGVMKYSTDFVIDKINFCGAKEEVTHDTVPGNETSDNEYITIEEDDDMPF